VKEILRLNNAGKRADKTSVEITAPSHDAKETFQNMAGQGSINRFDKSNSMRRRKKNPKKTNFRRGPR